MGSQEFDWHSGRQKFQTELTGTVTGGELAGDSREYGIYD